MNYKGKLKSGEEVLLLNDGEQTRIELKSGDSSSHESQSSGFDTGKWSEAPQLFATKDGAVLQIIVEHGSQFFALGSHAVEQLETAPDLKDAESIDLAKTDETLNEVSIKPMAPMKLMEPLKPLEPLS